MAQTQELLPAHEQDGPRPTPVAQPEGTEPEAVKKLRELFAKGAPKPADVLAILDAHRSDRAAILAFLHANAGNGFVAQVMAEADKLRLSFDRRELVAGDPSDPGDGYFIASQKEKGARWRTADGGFTGSIDSKGLDSRLRTGDDSSLHLNVNKQKEATLGLERNDGEVVGQLAGAYRGSDNWNVGVRKPFELDDGATLTPELRHQVRPELGAADVAALGYKDPNTTADLYAGRHESGGFAAGLAGSHRFDDRTSASGYLDYSPDIQRFGLGASHRYSDQLTLSGGLSHTERRHGDDVTAASLSARYRSENFVGSGDLSYAHSSMTGDSMRATASGDLRLAPNLYGGVFGDLTAGPDRPTGSLGASLTFTTTEKTALTAAGIIDDRGNLETRLEFDIFKKRIDSVGALADNRKKALISLFVSYTQGGRMGMLEDRYAAPQLGTDMPAGAGTVGAGIRIRF
jgi:hypothetical protein